MRKAKAVAESEPELMRRPALTPEARNQQLIDLAMWRAEQQLRDGTASSQVITHYLKLGTVKYQEEIEKLRKENELLTEKTETLKSNQRVEELYEQAIKSMQRYGGHTDD